MKQLLLFSVLFLLLSCQKIKISPDEEGSWSTCNVKNPVENLPWLKKQIEDFKESTTYKEGYCGVAVYQTVYQNEPVFIIEVASGPRMACCGCGGTAYNCQGEKVADCGGGNPWLIEYHQEDLIYQLIPQ